MVIIELTYRIVKAKKAKLTDEDCDEIVHIVATSDIDEIVIARLLEIIPHPERVRIVGE